MLYRIRRKFRELVQRLRRPPRIHSRVAAVLEKFRNEVVPTHDVQTEIEELYSCVDGLSQYDKTVLAAMRSAIAQLTKRTEAR